MPILSRAALKPARVAALALAALAGSVSNAYAIAQTPSISGNWFWAIGLALVGVWSLVLLVRGALFLEERDAWLRRGPGDGSDWTFRD